MTSPAVAVAAPAAIPGTPLAAGAPAAKARLPLPTKLFYGLGTVAFGVKDNGFSYLLLIFYNQVVGLPAPVVGAAIMIAMIFDAFLDPIVGQVSDNWRSRWGRRHPFMYAAALPVALSYLALWNPPHWPAAQLFWYLMGVAIVIRTFITFYEVPSSALSAELTQDYDERTVLLSYRYFFGWVGGLALYVITFTFLLVPDAHHPVGQTNPAGYARYGLLAAAIMFIAILVSAAGTHGRIRTFKVPPRRRLTLLATLREMGQTWANRSFIFLTFSGLAMSMAAGLSASMNIYFSTYFWEFSPGQLAALASGVFLSAIIALPSAPQLSRAFGKRASAMGLMAASVVTGLAPMLLRLAGLMPPNHSPALFAVIFLQAITTTAFYIAATTLLSAMIADVVEDGELKTGRRSEGLYFSASSLIAKAVSGIGIFAASMILGFIRFPKAARPGHVEIQVIAHMALVYAPILLALYVISIVLLFGYRITRQSHAETVRLLAAEAEELKHPG